MGGKCGTGDTIGASRVLVGISDGKRRLGRRRCRCENNIKMYLQHMNWNDLVQDMDRCGFL
jgi:hypothetical protein